MPASQKIHHRHADVDGLAVFLREAGRPGGPAECAALMRAIVLDNS
ncbi:hypothetical protein [Micromonospora marina]